MGVMGSPGESPSFRTPKRATALVYIVTSLEASPWRACLYPLHVLLLFCGWWMPGRRSRVVLGGTPRRRPREAMRRRPYEEGLQLGMVEWQPRST